MKFFFRKRTKTAQFGHRRQCLRCGDSFVLTNIELSYYATAGLPQPVVCRPCIRTVDAPVDEVVEKARVNS